MAAERPSPETALPAVLAEQSARLRKLFIIADSDMPQAVSAAVQLKGAMLANGHGAAASRVLAMCNNVLMRKSINPQMMESVLLAAGLPPDYRAPALPKGFSAANAFRDKDPSFRRLLAASHNAENACIDVAASINAHLQKQCNVAKPQPQAWQTNTQHQLQAQHHPCPDQQLQPPQQEQPHRPRPVQPEQQRQQAPDAVPHRQNDHMRQCAHSWPSGMPSTSEDRSHAPKERPGFRPPLQTSDESVRPMTRPEHKPHGTSMWAQPAVNNGKRHAPSVAHAPPGTRAVTCDNTIDHSVSADDEDAVAGSRPAAMGFTSAKAQLAMDLAKKGQSYNKAYGGSSAPAPRAGLQRPPKRQALAGGRDRAGMGGGAGVRGYTPPFVQKALDGPGEDGECPYSEQTMQLLALPDGTVPEEVQKLDPKIVDQVCNEILDASASISWDDIAGQQHAKRLVQEIVVWPMLNPQLFTGARAPPRGILLFGPPGTGKTLLGKAIASNISATFFSISASSLTSKWIGEGEKMVKALFTVARCLQPSVIFIDEIDSILSARKSEGEHESSRRLKTEMLIQMEGCDPKSSASRVLLIGATNRPEELDDAARRRLPKQLYVSLPCGEARREMVLRMLSGVTHSLGDTEVTKVVSKTAGYSGSDMRNYVQEACQGPIRDASRLGQQLQNLQELDLRPVVLRDFQVAARAQKRSVTDEEVVRYELYNDKHGARYTDVDAMACGEDEEW